MDCNEEETEATKKKIYGVNPVISREYVEKNYIHKDIIRDDIKYLENFIKIGGPLYEIQKAIVIKDFLKEILEETKDGRN